MKPGSVKDIALSTIKSFFADDALTLGAAIAFYTILALAPMVMISLSVISAISPNGQQQLIDEVAIVIGYETAKALEQIIENLALHIDASSLSAIFGVIMLIISIAAVFAQLQQSLNKVWGVRAVPRKNLHSWLRKRVLSMGMILAMGFLLTVSLAFSALISLLFSRSYWLWQIVNFLASFVAFTGLFALIYRFLPDTRIAWRDAFIGASMTSALFCLGKYLIGIYLGQSAVGSVYGAAGSLVVILVWVYYASLIFFLGAELTQEYTKHYGSRIRPEDHAEMVTLD